MPTPWVVTLHAHTLEGVFIELRKVGDAVELSDEAEEVVAGLGYPLRRGGPARAGRRTPPPVWGLGWGQSPDPAGRWGHPPVGRARHDAPARRRRQACQ